MLPPQDRLPILQSAGKTGALLEGLAIDREAKPLPISPRGNGGPRDGDEVDVVFVTGDAYVDHPSFAAAILSRVLEAAGFRVGSLTPARLAELRAVADVWASAAVFCDQCGQYGFDDQSLYGQPQGP